MKTPDISQAYQLALALDRQRGGCLLDLEDISEDIAASNQEFLSDVHAFNGILDSLNDALIHGDIPRQDKELVRLRVYASNFVTTFTNLTDDLGKIVKEYAFLSERNNCKYDHRAVTAMP